MTAAPAGRLRALDLIRGVAVLGILAVNVAAFASSGSAVTSPDLPQPGSPADHAAWLVMFVLFEGKMRALFSILFGASLLLFIERADAAGRDGARLQARRLGWLMAFGYLHYLLIWDGDILFLYGAIGFAALALRGLAPKQLLFAAVLMLGAWEAVGVSLWAGSLADEQAVLAGTATPQARQRDAADRAGFRAEDTADRADAKRGWSELVRLKATKRASTPLDLVAFNWGETLPWMLLGMALLKSGFFAGVWPRRRLLLLAGWSLGLGGGATLAFAAWAARSGYPPVAMRFGEEYGSMIPHTAMALGYAALLVAAARFALRTVPGQMLEAAGKMAFSNYIGTSLVMTALCSAWGLGLAFQFGAAQRWTLVLLVWALMLAWSQPWLLRFRQGPMEWLWRSLTESRLLPNRRPAPPVHPG